MIVVVTTDEGDVVWRSGGLANTEGLCCGQDDLPAVLHELQSAFCMASIMLGRFDDLYRVPDLCCAPAEVDNDVPVSAVGGGNSGR